MPPTDAPVTVTVSPDDFHLVVVDLGGRLYLAEVLGAVVMAGTGLPVPVYRSVGPVEPGTAAAIRAVLDGKAGG